MEKLSNYVFDETRANGVVSSTKFGQIDCQSDAATSSSAEWGAPIFEPLAPRTALYNAHVLLLPVSIYSSTECGTPICEALH